MATGQNGQLGLTAQRPVEMAVKHTTELVAILVQTTMVQIVLEIVQKQLYVAPIHVLLVNYVFQSKFCQSQS